MLALDGLVGPSVTADPNALAAMSERLRSKRRELLKSLNAERSASADSSSHKESVTKEKMETESLTRLPFIPVLDFSRTATQDGMESARSTSDGVTLPVISPRAQARAAEQPPPLLVKYVKIYISML